ncbi:hypothetical protein RNJ44_01963 [Nakaseomyces bracarensis]|uniref:VASt domain-containing protein n=1 Tax=Nakaseomyces bracarensis TaxID=273131 RepID=A0ABR4NP97_9SACH
MSDPELNDWEPVDSDLSRQSPVDYESKMINNISEDKTGEPLKLAPPFKTKKKNELENSTTNTHHDLHSIEENEALMEENLRETQLLPNERDYSNGQDAQSWKDIKLDPINTDLGSPDTQQDMVTEPPHLSMENKSHSNNSKSSADTEIGVSDNETKIVDKEINNSSNSFINNVFQTFSLSSPTHSSTSTDVVINSSKPTSPNIISHRRNPSHSKKKPTRTASVSSVTSPVSSPLMRVDQKQDVKDFNYDPNLYDKDTYQDSQFHYASYGRNIDFHNIFTSIPVDVQLIDEFNCTLSREFIYQGTLYVSESYLCFNSKILGWVSKVLISFRDITFIEKTSAAGIFPNAITIETEQGKTQFNGFVSRDHTFDLIKEVWSRTLLAKDDEEKDKPDKIDEKLEDSELEKEKSVPLSNIESDKSKSTSTTDLSQYSRSIEDLDNIYFKVNEKNDAIHYYGPYLLPSVTDVAVPTHDNEFIITEVKLDAPPGLAFQLLFNDPEAYFLKGYLAEQNAKEISNIGKFDKTNNSGEKTRSYSYEKPLGFAVGPKSTICYAEDILNNYDTRTYIDMITITKTPKVPSGGNFVTKTRYLFTWETERSCKLKISCWVEWTGGSWIKGIIESGCKSGQTEAAEALIPLAKKFIFENTDVATITDDFDPYAIAEIEEENELEKAIKLLVMKLDTINERVEVVQHKYDSQQNITSILMIIIILLLLIILYKR